MSIDINWETLTGGPDGAALAETIRGFIHDRFQAIPLPKLIRSVSVHGFEFGQIPPEVVLKDICDPLPDFYESDEDDSVAGRADDSIAVAAHGVLPDLRRPESTRHTRTADDSHRPSELDIMNRSGAPSLGRGTTPGVLGTTSNLGYFHMPLSAGLPGTQTPLAAMAGGHYVGGGASAPRTQRRHAESFSSASPPSTATPASSQDHAYFEQATSTAPMDDLDHPASTKQNEQPDRSPDDLQVVFHVTYAGDIKLSLTAEVFLDYPMPSFVGIPLKLKITGLTFNGVGILAYIRKRAHLCFLNPEDAEALVGGEVVLDNRADTANFDELAAPSQRVGALLEDIKIESEMGETDSGKQVLKNVGKIEKFIHEQVQRIFEDEFVYPSFWTFLV
ncbi:Mitochondrial distribution and morphology 12 [Lecanosticta acicola]|uniref:Mitochondrial distribution and morphology protein 12 n=1 Tax=Lecanosticta acicola TaxID=111012 RepID=A0AAI8YRB0_9PEZI|nr:Mitochondrial distribution and morphology 12 [Lecanosticta acicola]